MSLPTGESWQAKRYLRVLPLNGSRQDRRRLWAREDRELKGWKGLSVGERKRRDRFARAIGRQVEPLVAIREALDLDAGPIPELETLDEFNDYWSHALISEVAGRWLKSPYFRSFSKEQVRDAHTSLGAASTLFANTLIEACTDKETPAAVKVMAAKAGLASVGIVAGSKLENNAKDDRDELRKKGRASLTVVPKTGTDGKSA